MKKGVYSAVLIIIFLAGLSLLLYPTVSDYVNSNNQTKAISNYTEKAAEISDEEYDAYIQSAKEFNVSVMNRTNQYNLTADEKQWYNSLLNLTDTGVIGYVEIPSIDVTLPIYHGTSDSVLDKAIGHIEWTSLPVGGEGTHSVLSGHRGLPSAKLFTNLDKVIIGDIFMVQVLNETLTYEVDQILIVEPDDTSALLVKEGEDLCTLVTCTPYGINTHRLLVRGHRIDNIEASKTIRITSDATQIEPVIVAAAVAAPLLFIFMLWMIRSGRKKSYMDFL